MMNPKLKVLYVPAELNELAVLEFSHAFELVMNAAQEHEDNLSPPHAILATTIGLAACIGMMTEMLAKDGQIEPMQERILEMVKYHLDRHKEFNLSKPQ
jgi:uncharacterized OsmC-like protein